MSGRLFLVATPIGNLGDFSPRAEEALRKVDFLLAEDTRRARKLLSAYHIAQKPLSYFKFNEAARTESVRKLLTRGATVGYLCDAGTPGISDPGAHLVQIARSCGAAIEAIPGPSALSVAFSLSGFAPPFHFYGFYPKKKKDALKRASLAPGAHFFFVPPHDLLSVVQAFALLAPESELFLAKEISKVHEELFWGSPERLLSKLSKKPPKGEWVLGARNLTQCGLRTLQELLPNEISQKSIRKLAHELLQVSYSDLAPLLPNQNVRQGTDRGNRKNLKSS